MADKIKLFTEDLQKNRRIKDLLQQTMHQPKFSNLFDFVRNLIET